jgi:hypothetical protein
MFGKVRLQAPRGFKGSDAFNRFRIQMIKYLYKKIIYFLEDNPVVLIFSKSQERFITIKSYSVIAGKIIRDFGNLKGC